MCVDWLTDLDILTCFASSSTEIYKLLENNEALLDTPYNIIEAIIQVLVSQKNEEIELSDTDVLFDEAPKDEEAKLQNRNKKYSALLLNLSECKLFRSKYSQDLPFQIYEKVIKNQSNHAYKLLLNQNLDEGTISTLLTLIQKLTLEGNQLEKLSKMLKDDLNEASKMEDIGFIKKVIVPLLHSEQKMLIRINV